MRNLLNQLCRDDKGATAIEYGLIAALIVIAIITSVRSVANENTGLWASVSEDVDGAMNGD